MEIEKNEVSESRLLIVALPEASHLPRSVHKLLCQRLVLTAVADRKPMEIAFWGCPSLASAFGADSQSGTPDISKRWALSVLGKPAWAASQCSAWAEVLAPSSPMTSFRVERVRATTSAEASQLVAAGLSNSMAEKLLSAKTLKELKEEAAYVTERLAKGEKITAVSSTFRMRKQVEAVSGAKPVSVVGVASRPVGDALSFINEPLLSTMHRRALAVVAHQNSLDYRSGYPATFGGKLAVDTETTGLNPRRAGIVGISMSSAPTTAFVAPVYQQTEGHQPVAVPPPPPNNTEIIAHNWQYDAPVLRRAGWPLRCSFDTMIAAYVLGLERQGLKWLSKNCLGIEMQGIDDLIIGGAFTMADVPWSLIVPYAGADADQTLQLYQFLKPQIDSDASLKRVFDLEMRVLPMLIRMSDVGVRVDVPTLKRMGGEIEAEKNRCLSQIRQYASPSFNPDSPQQLSRLLFTDLGLEPLRSTDTPGQFATGKDILEELKGEHPIIELIASYRELCTLQRSFVDKLPGIVDDQTQRIHPEWKQTRVISGRLACVPNLMNIPIRGSIGDRVRDCFIPDKGFVYVGADYSSLEVRVMAHLSQDQNLIKVILDGLDPHKVTASKAFGIPYEDVPEIMRTLGKVTFFAVGYGAMEFRVATLFRPMLTASQARELVEKKMKTPPHSDPYLDLAKIVINSIYAAYDRLRPWKDQVIAAARQAGYGESLLGRRAYVYNLSSSSSKARAADERFLCNYRVQATASGDIMKLAMAELWDAYGDKGWFRPILQVHDELVIEVPEGRRAEEIRCALEAIMPYVMDLTVPLEVKAKIGRSWAQAH